MPKRTRDYDSWRLEKLADPQFAEGYLNDALADSPQMFLKALMNVTQAQQNVAAIATRAGVKRETIYRAFSKRGNPTLDTLNSVLEALGLTIKVAAKGASGFSSTTPRSARKYRQRGSRLIALESAGQSTLPFYETTSGQKEPVTLTANAFSQGTAGTVRFGMYHVTKLHAGFAGSQVTSLFNEKRDEIIPCIPVGPLLQAFSGVSERNYES